MRTLSVFVCALAHTLGHGIFMLAIRLYIFVLTSLFLVLVITHRGLGFLEAIVITCALLYLILDARSDLQALKAEVQLLNDLEERISLLLRS